MARRNDGSRKQVRERLQTHRRRAEATLDQRLLVIVACEGEKTEYLYLDAWFTRMREELRLSKQSLVLANHHHTNPTGVLEDLLSFRSADGLKYSDFQQRWIVIDRDEERPGGGGHTLRDFNAALEKARGQRKPVSVAWSNPCFELWYLLHFRYQNTGTDRDLALRQLGQELGRPYEKNDPTMYATLLPNVETALRNARKLTADAGKRDLTPDQSNPCTTVHLLVEALRMVH